MIKIRVKMWLFVTWYVLLQISQNHATILNPEFLSSYPFKDEYQKSLTDTDIDLDDKCPGFKCDSSGLNRVQINDLINKENHIRDRYADEKNITNIYSVSWNTYLADHAQARSHVSCFLPGTGNKVIYEHVTNQWRYEIHSQLKDYPTAVEVVIGSRTFPHKELADKQHAIVQFIEMFNKIDNISNPLERRGGTVDMGCSYLVTANTTHNTDYMVCLYGFLYFDGNTSTNKYNNEIGTPCSRCTFYSVVEEIPETRGQKWKCDLNYPHTCSNLSKRSTYDTLMQPNQFDCQRKINHKLKKPFLPSHFGLLPISTVRPISPLSAYNSTGGMEARFDFDVFLILFGSVVFNVVLYD